MRWGRLVKSGCAAWTVSMAFAACGTSTRMIVEPSTQSLAEKQRGVAVVKFSMPNENCIQQILIIGTREGNGHRLVSKLMATGAASATTANAAEVLLDPGEYHVLGYVCQRARSFVNFGNAGGPHTDSIGRFVVRPGEVVNIGLVTFKTVWGSKDIKVEVSDWSLADLNRFRDERPKLFAGMQTRLLELRSGKPLSVEEKDDKCGQLAEMKATGKIAQLPKGCG